MSTQFKFNINDSSIHHVCGGSELAAVYGFQHCYYDQVKKALESHPQIKRVYDLSLGENRPAYFRFLDKERITRLDGSLLEQIDSGISEETDPPLDGVRMATRQCKASITNLIVENLKRAHAGKECIPIIVCYDKDNNHIPPLVENILTKTKKIQLTPTFEIDLNSVVTHSEMRRMAKLCNDPHLDERIKEVARRSFKFVRVNEMGRETIKTPHGEEIHVNYEFRQIDTPWADPEFDRHLAIRKQLPRRPNALPKIVDWRAQINAVNHSLQHS